MGASLLALAKSIYYRILSLYSWQVSGSRPPLSEFSGFAPANVCNNLRRKVDKAS